MPGRSAAGIGVAALLVAGIAAAAPNVVLPNPDLTPGVFNPAVRQTTIRSTICVHGWTKTVRPPSSYTNRLKLEQMPLYHETGSPSEYEEDHFTRSSSAGRRAIRRTCGRSHTRSRVRATRWRRR